MRFRFTIDDPQAKWLNTALFEPNRLVEIQMGYSNALESVFYGEALTVKTVFSSTNAPKIEVHGEGTILENVMTAPVFGLEYLKRC